MDFEFVVGMAASVLLSAIKDPKKKAKIRGVALKIFKSLKAAYASDPEFQ